jgi:hypothetical protein
VRSTLDKGFEQNGRAQVVRPDELLNFIHRLADADFGRLVINDVNALDCLLDRGGVAHVAANELGLRVQILRIARDMNLWRNHIQDSHAMPERDERVDQMRPDKTGPAGD